MVGAGFLRYRPDDPMLRVIACPVLPNQLRHLSAPWPVPWRIVLLVRSRGDGISARHQINTQIAIKRSSAGPADNGIGNLVHILRIHMNFAIQVRSDSQSCSKGIAYLKPQGTPAYAMRFEGPTCASSKPVQGIARRRHLSRGAPAILQAASQWLLQEIEDTHRLAEALDRLGIAYSWHKVAPDALPDDDRAWFLRPVDESKELRATVQTSTRIIQLAQNRLKPSKDEIP